jgi:hypothetical protein
MATATGSSYPSYISIASIKKYWLDTIAPNYFDFENVNNYNVGIFGYVNEVMGNTTEDVFNAVAITRREFYPVTAQFISSLYTMATLQSVEIPLTKPSTCRCILIIPQSEIISNSTQIGNTGQFECVVDDCLKIFAGDLQFMLDYPIRILSKQNSATKEWSHTVHYDVGTKNSLAMAITSASASRYISTKILKENGVNYVALFIDTIRQLEMVEKNEIVVKDTILDTVTMDIDFDGNLANFEVFYKENANSEELQLDKYMINSAISGSNPYVQYELINTNKIRLTFAYNGFWTPKINSEVIVRIYTSEGSNGNFNQFTEDIVCSSNSEKYPYNANMTIIGRISGSAIGGTDQLLTQEFRNKIIMAYSTNKTIATENDLQLYFNDISDDIEGVKILFHKKRDDVFIRLFGAYSLYKDENEDIIPTNTLELRFEKSDLSPDQSATLLAIPAGSVFQYDSLRTAPAGTPYYNNQFMEVKVGELEYVAQVTPNIEYENIGEITLTGTTYYVYLDECEIAKSTVVPLKDENGFLSLMEAMRRYNKPAYDSVPYFTNPFMMIIHSDPNTCGYYLNSVEKTLPIEYTYINDNSFQQFIASTIEIYRDALAGNNFYRFRMRVTPTSDESVEFYSENDPTTTSNQIRATSAGMVVGEEYYYDSENGYGYIRTIIRYSNYDTTHTDIIIQSSNIFKIDNDNTPTLITGYKMNFKVGDSFKANDILAVKRCTDLGNVLLVGIIDGEGHTGALGRANLYIPMTIQDIDEDTGAMIMEGYVQTDDTLSSNADILLTHGVFQEDGTDHGSVTVPMDKETFTVDALYRDPDITDNSKYQDYTLLNKFTHTNTYMSSSDTPFDLITALSFIRSTVDFYPINPLTPYENLDYHVYIDRVPLLGARWAVDTAQFEYFVQQYFQMNENLNSAYLSLNNTFSIDSKFYNTYGRARFYTVGNKRDSMVSLDNVRCSFHFGVKLNTISNVDDFTTRFRNYVREYIESEDYMTNESQDIYIMSLISALKEEFEEIQYLEYYGFNNYNYSAQKIVGPDLSTFQEDFVPEFINLDIRKDSTGKTYPAVIVDIL